MKSLYQQLKVHLDAGDPIPYDLRLSLLTMGTTPKQVQQPHCINIQNSKSKSHLFQGDNLTLLHLLKQHQWTQWIEDNGGIKLIYIDPPYNVGTNFNTKDNTFAFADKWKSDGDYLQFLSERLELMYSLLAEDGSLYLHCDYRMSAPIKLLLDGIFGKKHFRNEIIWYFSNGGGRSRRYFNRKHNTIFMYTKSLHPIFNGKDAGVVRNQNESTFSGYFKTDKDGRRYQEVRSNNKKYIYYQDEKKNADDVWTIPIISQRDKTERVDYPTQKPIELMERIIRASSNPGDLIADFFCGSGTTIITAEKLERKWIGCDKGEIALERCIKRLQLEKAYTDCGHWTIV
jgi:DNA modification methylase